MDTLQYKTESLPFSMNRFVEGAYWKHLNEMVLISTHNIIITPTKPSNAQHLEEYKKQQLLLQEENKKSGNVMQQPMHSYVCGLNLRSESSLV